MLGTPGALSMSYLSHRSSEPVYYIKDCRISHLYVLPHDTPTNSCTFLSGVKRYAFVISSLVSYEVCIRLRYYVCLYRRCQHSVATFILSMLDRIHSINTKIALKTWFLNWGKTLSCSPEYFTHSRYRIANFQIQ